MISQISLSANTDQFELLSIAFAAYGCSENVVALQLLINRRAILVAALRMIDTNFGWFSKGHSHNQSTDLDCAILGIGTFT